MFALYWDESDPDVPETKIRRAIYTTLDEAKAQATHDTMCLRCRIFKDGLPTLKATGKEPLDPTEKQKCRDCNGTKVCPSRNILRIEELDTVERDHMNLGVVVWEP